MREPERDNGRIQDMLEHAQNIMDFVQGVAFEDFVKDKILYFALVKNLEIIGEAAYMLTPAFKQAHPEIAWEPCVKMRHILVHGYASVEPEIVWDTAVNDIPRLKGQLEVLRNR